MSGERESEIDFLQWAVNTLGEINPSNYDHDNVCELNQLSVEVALAIQARLAELAREKEDVAGLRYRPNHYDDWGMIRNADGSLFAVVSRPLSAEEANRHREAATDPFEPLARALMAGIARAASPQPPARGAEVVAQTVAGFIRDLRSEEDDQDRPADRERIAGWNAAVDRLEEMLFEAVADTAPTAATPPTAEEITRWAREEALEEAAREFDKAADYCHTCAGTLPYASDSWKVWSDGEYENRRSASRIRALAKPPGETP